MGIKQAAEAEKYGLNEWTAGLKLDGILGLKSRNQWVDV